MTNSLQARTREPAWVEAKGDMGQRGRGEGGRTRDREG